MERNRSVTMHMRCTDGQTQRRKQQHLIGHYTLTYGKFWFYLHLQGIHFRKKH